MVDKDVLKKAKYIMDKQDLNKKKGTLIKKISDTSNLVINTALTTKIGKVGNKIPDVSGLVSNTTLNTCSGEVKKNSFSF